MVFLSYDIQPVVEMFQTCEAYDSYAEAEAARDKNFVEYCDHGNIFWGLYGRDENGYAYHVADRYTYTDACELYTAITGLHVDQNDQCCNMNLPRG